MGTTKGADVFLIKDKAKVQFRLRQPHKHACVSHSYCAYDAVNERGTSSEHRGGNYVSAKEYVVKSIGSYSESKVCPIIV